jgi:hypothetical protein
MADASATVATVANYFTDTERIVEPRAKIDRLKLYSPLLREGSDAN